MSYGQPVAGGSTCDGLVGLVEVDRIAALMVGRRPEVLTHPQAGPVVVTTVRGVATEVAAVLGPSPSAETLELGGWAVTLGSAASLEAALFPEQNVGDAARSNELRARYLGVLSDLRRAAGAAGAAGGRVSGLVHLGAGGYSASPLPDPYY